MERKDEIKKLLKSLLGKMETAIDTNDISKIILSSKGVVELSKQIEKYVNELANLDQQ